MSSQNVNDIKKTIKNIKTIIQNIELKGINSSSSKEDYFWKNHPELMNKYTFLISQLCSNTDNTMLDVMIKQLEQVEKGKNMDEADKEIGEKLANSYLPKNN
jgi:hypothetical protein